MFDFSDKPPSHYESRATVRQYAVAYMNQLQGWCSQEKASILVDLVLNTKPQKIVEIGVWGGKSFVPMAAALRANGKGMAYGIDPWRNEASVEEAEHPSNIAFWSYVDHEAVRDGLVRKIFEFNLENHIELIQATSEEAASIYDIDVLHIDGNHSEKTSYFDVTKWVPLVRKGGVIVFDDMTWFENGIYTTAKAVEWLDTHCFKLAEFNDVSVWGIWIKL